ncbi:MAG TPA: HAMP domain-containing sensor histidine kinase [Actinomycetota bacterium]|nr:HAMP domain-containing sensor histidine kinase [Actinomycetota bacterium]
MQPDRYEWPNRLRWWDIAWVLFSLANLYAMLLLPDWETVPFHFIWVSLTILYGFRVWKARPTTVILVFVMVLTGTLIWIDVARGITSLDEITEVPLMAAMFVAMVWHARRRLTATEETERVSMANLRLLERERRFVQDASHELRTPITVALGHAELIQRTARDPTLAEDAAVIADELMRLRRLANRLLLLAGAEDPEFLHLEPVDVETIVVEAVRRWTATPRRWLLGSTEEATVMADADRLEVALDALIENAVNHTVVSDTIEVAIRRRDARAVISVRDTGAGIPAPDLDQIFARFARADPGRSRHTGNFGLGLSIVKAIVDAHGGEVHVASAVGVETTFEILLPLSPVVPDRPERTSRQGTAGLAPASTPAGRAFDTYARDHDV